MTKWIKHAAILMFSALLFGCGSDSNSDGGQADEPVVQQKHTVTVVVKDANSQLPLAGVFINIDGNYKTTSALGEVTYNLDKGTYTISSRLTDYLDQQKSVSVAGQDIRVTFELEEDVMQLSPEEGFVFYSDNDDSFYMEYWGDDWGSGAGVENITTDPVFSKVLEISSGNSWGNGAGLAWGNQEANAIDTSRYTHVRFNLKPQGFHTIEVNVQGFDIPNYQASFSTSSGTDIGNGWYQFEVPITTTSQLRWLGFVFLADQPSSIQLSNVSFITKEIERSAPNLPAPTPSVLNSDVFSIFSDSLDEDKFVSLWNENWWNAPFYSQDEVEGNAYARYEIQGAGAAGGVVGIQFGIEYGSVDVSEHNTWNIDLYLEPGISQVVLQLVTTDGSASYTVSNLPAEQWVSMSIPFADMSLNGESTLNTAQMQMAGIQLYGEAGRSIFVDNFYFSGQSSKYAIEVEVVDSVGQPISNAEVSVGVDGEYDVANTSITDSSGVATLMLVEGKQKIKGMAQGYGINQASTIVTAGSNQLTLELTALSTGPTAAAPSPIVDSDDVISLYSDALTSDHWITYWSDNWWNAPTHEDIQIEGNNTAKFTITPDGVAGGVTGIQYGISQVVDASAMTGLRFDFYATAGVTRAQFQLLSTSGPLIYTIDNIATGEWVSVELDFDLSDTPSAVSGFNKSTMTQLGMALWGSSSDSVYLDNIYFY